LLKPGSSFNSIQDWHGNVEDEKIGIQADNSRNRAFSVLNGGNDIKLTVKQLCDSLKYLRLVIGQQLRLAIERKKPVATSP
jgi:hypothetical protein